MKGTPIFTRAAGYYRKGDRVKIRQVQWEAGDPGVEVVVKVEEVTDNGTVWVVELNLWDRFVDWWKEIKRKWKNW